MVSKEDFIKVWKDSSRESILNQYYYDYKTLREQYDIWNELKEDISYILEMIEHNKDVIKVTSDEELAIYSLQEKMEKIEEE